LLAACDDDTEGTNVGLAVGTPNGSAGTTGSSDHLSAGGASGHGAKAGAGGETSGAGGETSGAAGETSSAGAGGSPVVDDCDCVPIAGSATSAVYLTMGPAQATDTCAADEARFYKQPNAAKCPSAICTSSGASFYESTCDEFGGKKPNSPYVSFAKDYALCRPLDVPAGGGAFFEKALVFWSCSPGDTGAPFDETYCAKQHSPPSAASCPAKTFCVPKSAGAVCVPGFGTPPQGWVKGDFALPSACISASDALTSPMKATAYGTADCTGQPLPVAPDTCTAFSDQTPIVAYKIDAPDSQKTPPGADVLTDVAELFCRP
jgi:hypothetical protein